jgi:hypothetical protein
MDHSNMRNDILRNARESNQGRQHVTEQSRPAFLGLGDELAGQTNLIDAPTVLCNMRENLLLGLHTGNLHRC